MSNRNNNYISLDTARNDLITLWIIFSVPIILLAIFISIFRIEYREIQQELWTWIAPLLVPNFSLMLSVSASEALVNNNGNSSKVRRKYYQLSYRLSAAYLILILLSMFLEMFFSADYNPLGILKVSGLWIAIFQGFVTSAIGVLFFTKKEKNS